MILKTSDRFLSLPCTPDTSLRLTKSRPIPHDAHCTVAHCDIFMRVGLGAMTDEIGKVLQIKVTIQYSIANIEWLL